MKVNRLFTAVLVLQLILAFFCPPIPLGERLLFGADVWLFVWVPVFWLAAFLRSNSHERKSLFLQTAVFGIIFGTVFAHGYGRPSIATFLLQYIDSPRDDLFSPTREAIVAARFLFGCWGAMVVARLRPERLPIFVALGACCALASLSMVLAWLSPSTKAFLGELYSYRPDASPWAERIYGVFRSPIEGSVTLCLSFLLLLQPFWALTGIRYATLGLVLIGVFLSKTLTAFLALLFALVYAGFQAYPSKKAYRLMAGTLTFLVLAGAAFWNSPFVSLKRENFLFRFKPWSVYWDLATSRIDRLLLGNGFHPHFSDAIYVFLFSRGGLLLLGGALFASWVWWKRNHARLSPLQKAIPFFIAVSGLTVDNLILRPSAYVFICVGILALNCADTSNSRSHGLRHDNEIEKE